MDCPHRTHTGRMSGRGSRHEQHSVGVGRKAVRNTSAICQPQVRVTFNLGPSYEPNQRFPNAIFLKELSFRWAGNMLGRGLIGFSCIYGAGMQQNCRSGMDMDRT